YLLGQGDVESARAYVVRAYAVAPAQHRAALLATLAQLEVSDPRELAELAEADWKRSELAPALDWTERLLAQRDDPALRLRRARILKRLGRLDDALAAYQECAARAPQDFEVWSELASYLHELGRDEEARRAVDHALELDVPASYPAELRARAKDDL